MNESLNSASPGGRHVQASLSSPETLTTYSGHQNPIQALAAQPVAFTEREAELIRNFSENLALWVSTQGVQWLKSTNGDIKVDVTDVERHFEIEVPRRAFTSLVLRFAIFSFSSQHMNRHLQGDWAEALQYHTDCLKLLIPVLSGGQENYSEDILVTVAILRLGEEMDGSHLSTDTFVPDLISSQFTTTDFT